MSIVYRPRRVRRGSALSLTIVVSVILTSMAMTLAWLASVHANSAGEIPKIDAAFYAAEAGAQNAVWKFKHDNQWRATTTQPFTGSISMYGTTWNYAATCLDQIGNSTLAWKFDENTGTSTADSTGHGNTGTFHGGITWCTPGRSGSCIQLDGTTGTYVDCGNNSSTNITGDMTFSAWVKMNSGYYDQKIGGNQGGASGGGGGYKLCIYNSKAEFEVRDAANNAHLDRDVGGGTTLTMGTWYHIVGEYCESGHWIKTYVDGKFDRILQGDGTGTGLNDVPTNALGSSTGTFKMGCECWDPTSLNFNGWMDDIRIWNRILSDDEIQSLYDTTVDIKASAYDGTSTVNVHTSNTTYSASVPTPPPPTIPAITVGSAYTANNITVSGDVSCNAAVTCTNAAINGNLIANGNVTSSSGTSTVAGNMTYSGTYTASNFLTVKGKTTKAGVTVNQPTIDFAALQSQATNSGKVVSGDSSNQTYAFNTYGGNKVIWIKGNLQDPTVTIGGTYAAGGTFVVDGNVTFSKSSAVTLGQAGYPVYIVAAGNISQTGTGTLTLTGALYTSGNFTHKNCAINGPIWVSKTITNSSSALCTFSTAAIPWFDNRALPQPPTSAIYTTSHTGIGP